MATKKPNAQSAQHVMGISSPRRGPNQGGCDPAELNRRPGKVAADKVVEVTDPQQRARK